MIDKKLINIFQKHTKIKYKNSADIYFQKIKDWDSLKQINFMFEVEKNYSIKINIEKFSKIKSLKDVNKIIKNNLKRKSKT